MKKYNELKPLTRSERYVYSILEELVEVRKNLVKLNKQIKKNEVKK